MEEQVENEVGELEAVEEQIEQQQVENSSKTAEEEVPAQFKGKSIYEIAKYALDTEKALSRQGRELGDLRRLTDDFIKAQLKPPEPKEAPKSVDFFENPQEAIRQAVANAPEVLEARQIALQARQEQSKQRFAQLHPDYGSILQEPEFMDWVKSSPVRMMLLRQANAYDVDAGNELFSVYKSLKGRQAVEQSEEEKEKIEKTLKSASVDTGGSGEGSRKIFSRRAIREMQIRDPQKFAKMRSQIDAAYREGRIKP